MWWMCSRHIFRPFLYVHRLLQKIFGYLLDLEGLYATYGML